MVFINRAFLEQRDLLLSPCSKKEELSFYLLKKWPHFFSQFSIYYQCQYLTSYRWNSWPVIQGPSLFLIDLLLSISCLESLFFIIKLIIPRTKKYFTSICHQRQLRIIAFTSFYLCIVLNKGGSVVTVKRCRIYKNITTWAKTISRCKDWLVLI